MASIGPNNPGTAADGGEAVGGTRVWTNPGNIASSDNVYATVSVSASGVSTNTLRATNYGFSVPAGATIDGIVVEVERKASAGPSAPGVQDFPVAAGGLGVRLIKGGVISGTDHSPAFNTVSWSTTEGYVTYGSSSDLWGLTLTDTDVNASTFGVAISCRNRGGGKSTVTASVDHIRITVFYTGGGGGSFIARSNKVIGQAINRASTY